MKLPEIVVVRPAEALLSDSGALGLGSHVLVRIGGAVRLAEGVTAGDERNGFYDMAMDDSCRRAARNRRSHVSDVRLSALSNQ